MPPADYIAASDGSGEAVRAIVTTERLVGATTLIVDSVQYWPNKFIATSGTLDITTGLLDENTLTVFKGTLTGSIITIDEYAPGYSDIGHTVGQVVVLKPSTFWADTLKDHLDSFSTIAQVVGEVLFPVGAIYTSVVATNPATLLGFGTWVAFGEGKVMVGLDSGDADFDTIEETGGAKTQDYTHDHLTAHGHDSADGFYASTGAGGTPLFGSSVETVFRSTSPDPGVPASGSARLAYTSTSAGGSLGAENPLTTKSIVQPYVVVSMWRRTA